MINLNDLPSNIEIKKRIRFSRKLFKTGDAYKLSKVCAVINRKQPQFTAVALSWQNLGLTVEQMEDLFETFLVLFHALSVGCKVKFHTITMSAIVTNIEAFAQFSKYYEMEADLGEADPNTIKFIENKVLLKHAALSLQSLEVLPPKEVIGSYFGLIKALDEQLK